MAKQKYRDDDYAHHAIDYQGNDPRENPGGLPIVDDVRGCAARAKTPDEVEGAAGNLQSVEEARKL